MPVTKISANGQTGAPDSSQRRGGERRAVL